MRNLRYFEGGDGEEAAAPSAPTALEPDEIVRSLYCILYRQYNPRAVNYGKDPLPQWDGGQDRWGRNHRPIWPRLADYFLQHSIDPHIYLYVQFAETIGKNSPSPNTLMSADSLLRYQAYMHRAEETLREDKARSALHVDRRLRQLEDQRGTDAQKILTVIMDETAVSACALFRYCFASRFDIAKAMARYFSPALRQYIFQPELYDNAWGVDFIPSQLRDEARRLRPSR